MKHYFVEILQINYTVKVGVLRASQEKKKAKYSQEQLADMHEHTTCN